jgi:methionyl-tRNA synthetase
MLPRPTANAAWVHGAATMSQRFYVTTPIYYVNDKPHIGHAYCTILADTARRYHGLFGEQTYFVTGTDEHGQKVQEAADKRGIAPQQHVDELHGAFKRLLPDIKCEPDQFIRTTEPRHKAVVQRALNNLWDRGLIYESEFVGWYSPAAERYWTDKDLVNGRCPDTGQAVVELSEKAYFFKMSLFRDRIADAVKTGKMKILPPNRGNEVLGFLREELRDLCISRPKKRLSWGIELPFDPDFVCYVWFDALLNYVTAIGGFGADKDNASLLDGSDLRKPATSGGGGFERWWPHVHHFLGKDILTTHAVYWPAMLMALELPVPANYVTTGWWLMDDTKMSKSLGNVVSPLDLKDRYGAEVLRYFLLREMAVGQDANFSEDAVVGRNNTDLANDLGNLVQRTAAIVAKNFDGKVPELPADREPSEIVRSAIALGTFLATGDESRRKAANAAQASPVRETLDAMKLHVTLADIMLLVQRLNQVLASDQPFKVIKTDKDAAAVTIYHTLEGIRFAANMLWPAIPNKAEEIFGRIGWFGGVEQIDALNWGDLPGGGELVPGTPLFPKYQKPSELAAAVENEAKRLKKEKARQPTASEGDIDFATFSSVDMRVGVVLEAEDLPKSRKLLKLQVDLGELGHRQILAGVKPHLTPEQLQGKRIVVLANLAPRKIMSLVSQGMMLVAEDADGSLVPLSVDKDLPPGAKIS